jgi:hypothetical protein
MNNAEIAKLQVAIDELENQVSMAKHRLMEIREDLQCAWTPPQRPHEDRFTWDQLIMKDAKVGDTIRHKSAQAPAYVVTSHYGSRITAVNNVDVTNEMEWEVLTYNRPK